MIVFVYFAFDMLHDHVDGVAKVVAQIAPVLLHLFDLEYEMGLELALNVLQANVRRSAGLVHATLSV
jgi:hypothetical protein